MIEKFDLIQCEVDEFEKKKENNDLLAIAIVSIGKGLAPKTNDSDREFAITKLGLDKPKQKCIDKSKYFS